MHTAQYKNSLQVNTINMVITLLLIRCQSCLLPQTEDSPVCAMIVVPWSFLLRPLQETNAWFPFKCTHHTQVTQRMQRKRFHWVCCVKQKMQSMYATNASTVLHSYWLPACIPCMKIRIDSILAFCYARTTAWLVSLAHFSSSSSSSSSCSLFLKKLTDAT